ncbi:MAG: DMT family transporter [Hoeflea sp.]|uniref:DMT family transporter n=1 Tax=Hoeflea sp. TaxID=1940281 RepID=UPI001D3E515D|nr:DMT family transporter [Hoeflea sp.]MBU4530747.1 DMT family transporter [Alphaproteobacteria bacterium]MBU4544746.1 DMT family transporter [Alphaproteobacteria bacterium]MBU4549302.1 DMT family transporter [Alphaproteobacteria bacterium]MBV1726341.1 DMT family transporter [Hoeflea sp.]MBV1761683.1 DMT family transporter [Hoeflea sp.]
MPLRAPALPIRAYLFLTITALSWGANAVAGKLAVGHISPMMLTSVRWGLALMILVSFTLPQVRRDMKTIRANLPLLIGYGMVGFAFFNILLYSALEYTTAINVAIEQAGMPMLIFLANFLLFRIKVTIAQVAGFVLTLAGVAITVSGGSLARLIALELNRGDALMLLAVLCYGGYTVALRYKPVLHWQSMITVMAASAFVTSLPFTASEILRDTVIWPDTRGWLVAAFTAVFPSLISQVLFIKGNELIGSNRAGLFINLVPIFGTILSVLILGEMLQLYHVVALALVLGGITLAERGKR